MAIQDTIDSGMNSVMPAVLVTNSPDEILKRFGGELVTKTVTLAGGAGDKVYDCFTITGVIEVIGLWAVFTTAADMTGVVNNVSFKFYDGANEEFLTLDSGTNVSGALAGAILCKSLVAASPVAFKNSDRCGVIENARDATCKCITLVSKTGATNKIQLEITQEAATSAVLKVYVSWHPLSATGTLVAS